MSRSNDGAVEGMDEDPAAMMPESSGFRAFSGEGNRLDGKKKKLISESDSEPGTSQPRQVLYLIDNKKIFPELRNSILILVQSSSLFILFPAIRHFFIAFEDSRSRGPCDGKRLTSNEHGSICSFLFRDTSTHEIRKIPGND